MKKILILFICVFAFVSCDKESAALNEVLKNERIMLQTSIDSLKKVKANTIAFNDSLNKINQYIMTNQESREHNDQLISERKKIEFEINGNKIKVCFPDTFDKKSVETVRLILLNKGLVMEKYLTFASNIEEILEKVNQLEEIVNSNDRKSKKWSKAKDLVKWVADKGVDVGTALLPIILQIGQ